MIRNKLLAGMLALAVAVSILTPALAAPVPFTDVPTSAWYYQDVQTAYNSALINGRSGTSFAPNGNLTYAEAVKLAACMNQKYTKGSVTLASGTDRWYSTYVDYAKANRIISRDYSWNANATRAGYVEIFAHALPDAALAAKNTVADNAIPDVKSSHPQAAEIYKLYRAGILAGNDAKGTFLPNSNIKRSEVAAILTRMMDQKSRLTLSWAAVSKTVLDKAEASSIRNAIIQYLFGKSVKSYPEATNILKEAAEQYLLNGTDPKAYLAGKDLGAINVYTFDSYTDAASFVESLSTQKHSLVNILSNTSEVDYKNYGVAVARVGEKATVCIVTEGGNANTPSGPVSPTPVAPDPTPSDPTPVTPTPSSIPSNDEIANQIFEYIKLNVPGYGITKLPTRNTQLDAAAKLITDGKYTEVDDALKAAGFSKPYLETTSPSDPYTTISYSYWSEKFDNQTYTDIVTFFGNLLKNGSKILGVTYTGNNAGLVYTDIGISVTGSGENKTVGFVLYDSNSKTNTLDVFERAHYYAEQQLLIPLNASAEQYEMLDMINSERKNAGLEEVQMLPILNEIATARAKEYYEAYLKWNQRHVRPDGSGYKTIFKDYGVWDYASMTAENYTGAYSCEDAMERLMNSAGHRAQILKGSFKYVGIARYDEPNHEWDSWIQIFADW